MRVFILLLIAGFLGLFAGGASALWMGGIAGSGPRVGEAVRIDGWTSDWSIGSDAANPYIRARIARFGLLALRKEEAVYFTTAVDTDGKRLNDDCIYRITGGAMPAEWWSITLYDGDSRLPMNEDGALSFDASNAAEMGASDQWSFRVGPDQKGRPDELWVSSHNAGEFDLTLRLYLPTQELLDDPENTLQPPVVKELYCDGRS